MGGTAYLIHGDLEPSRLDPVPRRRSLVDRLRGRHRYDETTYADIGRCTLIDVPAGELSRQIVSGFNDFLARQMSAPWSATESLLDYLRIGCPNVYLRGERSKDSGETDWYVQLSFSGCAGMAEVSAELGYHWAELWVRRDIEQIDNTILRPKGFVASRKLVSSDDPVAFVPVGTKECAVYSSVSLRDGEHPEFDADASILEPREDGGEAFLADIEEQLGPTMADGKCRCQLCMPDYSHEETVAI